MLILVSLFFFFIILLMVSVSVSLCEHERFKEKMAIIKYDLLVASRLTFLDLSREITHQAADRRLCLQKKKVEFIQNAYENFKQVSEEAKKTKDAKTFIEEARRYNEILAKYEESFLREVEEIVIERNRELKSAWELLWPGR